jgi:hypothetical protein
VARKRLIKGANASRVEERIARVPADLASSAAEGGIFGALRAMEAVETASPEAAAPKAPHRAVAPKAAPKVVAKAPRAAAAKPLAPKAVAQAAPAKPGRLSPSDFSAAEREAIVRCCSDYRNHLPIYLQSAQKEVKVIDSVIGKCNVKKKTDN